MSGPIDALLESLNISCPLCAAGPAQYCIGPTGTLHTSRVEAYRSLRASERPVKNKRPSFESIYMQMAIEIAKRSTCTRLNVGCVIASADFRQVLAVGYNGNATGLVNACDSDTVGACGCLHGEENAIINCVAPRTQDKIVFCTDLPCKMCSKRLVNLGGVQRVYYLREYRLRDGEEVLGAAGIPITQLLLVEGAPS